MPSLEPSPMKISPPRNNVSALSTRPLWWNISCDVRYKIQSSLILQKEVRSCSLQCINCMLVELNLIVIFVVHYSSLFKSDLNIEHSHRCIIVTFLCMRNMTRTLTAVCHPLVTQTIDWLSTESKYFTQTSERINRSRSIHWHRRKICNSKEKCEDFGSNLCKFT